MFNPLTRTLKIGLTALAILIVGGFAFAPTAAEAVDRRTDDQIALANCTNNPWGGVEPYSIWYGVFRNIRRRTYVYGQNGCAHFFTPSQLSYHRAKWCSVGNRHTDSRCTVNHTGLPQAVVDRPNAGAWNHKNPNAPTSFTNISNQSQFVRGAVDGYPSLLTVIGLQRVSKLNLRDDGFNSTPSEGDNKDGAFFVIGRDASYGGIFSETDLGAPVTGNSGTTASWAGEYISYENVYKGGEVRSDFVLEVTFGHADPGTAGSVEAFIKGKDTLYTPKQFYLEGTFSNGGVIDGTVKYGAFWDNNRKLPIPDYYGRSGGSLTGLIGERGAVGAFISDNNAFGGGKYAGVFVAHPTIGQDSIKSECDKDPFHEFCHVGTRSKVAMEERRSDRITSCIQDDGLADDPYCESAVQHHPCIINPFGNSSRVRVDCANDPGFSSYVTIAREKRVEFCKQTGNARDVLCTVAVASICEYAPFAALCNGRDNIYHSRTTRAKICAAERQDARCIGARYVSLDDACERVPFGSACTSGDYQNDRVKQAKKCAGNPRSSGCDATYYVETDDYCELVPFGGACANGAYQSYRVTQAKKCAANSNASGCDRTYHVETDDYCGLVPFVGTCLNNGDYKNKRIARADYCTTNMSDLVCNGVVSPANICSQLPFHSTCTGNEGNDAQRLARARHCVDDDNGDDPFCDKGNVTTAHICSQLPFHSTCVGNDDERFERAKRCVRTPSDSLCDTNDVTPADICSQLPFRSGCTDNASAKLALANRCILTPRDSRCHSDYVSTDDICSQRPFNAICDGLDDQRLDRAELCVANDNGGDSNPLCNKQYVSKAQICSQLPYHSTCSDTGYEHYRAARITYCNDELNKGNERCTFTEVVDALCSINLFGTGCVNHSDPDGVHGDKRRDRITICNEAGNIGSEECRPADVVAAICAANLFGPGCKNADDPDGSYERERTGHIKFCNREVNIGKPECTHKDVVDAVCNNNLFGRGCVSSDDPDGVYAGKRATELNLCSANPGKSGCTGTERDDICRYTPFSAFCSNHADSEGNKTKLVTFCNDEGNEGNYRCTGTQRDDICSYAPFSPVCSNHVASAGKRTESAFNACRNPGSSNSACHGIQPLSTGKADAAMWADSLITFDNREGVSSIKDVDLSNVQYAKNQFLKGLQDASDIAHLSTRRHTPFTTLTLGDRLVDSTETLGGESEDGVAFFGLKAKDYGHRERPFYAGILSSTDLGAPITGTTDTVLTWNGVFQAMGGQGRATHRNFDLTVTFTGDATGTIGAQVEFGRYNHQFYQLAGTFDSVGVITGTVGYGVYTYDINQTTTPGKLTGLIGEEGAVGAFIANMDGHKGLYVGGFVVKAPPSVQYVDWVNSFDDELLTSPSTGGSAPNQFLKGGATELSNIGVTGVIRDSLNLADATFGGNRLGGDSVDGVAFFRGTHSSGARRYYAGILSGTNLGGPVTQTTGSADWNGSLQIVHSLGVNVQPSAVDFTLTVNFGRTGDRAGSISSTFRWGPSTLHDWTLSGHFDTNGIITGNLYNRSQMNAKVTGLIGQQGAVGAFHAIDGNTFSGGFVACPYDSVNNRCQQ